VLARALSKKELYNMNLLKHKNIIRLVDSFTDKNTAILIFEYCACKFTFLPMCLLVDGDLKNQFEK